MVRARPNTPAAVRQGITARIGNTNASEIDVALAENMLSAIGETVLLENEGQMDAVTGLRGSGPAYVCHLSETLAAAGQAQGLSHELAMKLAKSTVAGAFTYWANQKLMVYRYGLVLAGGQTASPEQIDTMITAAVLSAERYYPAIQLVTWGNRTPEDAMQVAIAEAYGRA